MTAPNHALTGALIGLTISNPVLALPLAFLSHFVLDAIPHYDPPEQNEVILFRSKRFTYQYLATSAIICFVLVLVLAATRPQQWIQAALSAFLAASPDLFWIPKFLETRRTGRDTPSTTWFLRFHADIQWKTGSKWLWVETVWFLVFSGILLIRL